VRGELVVPKFKSPLISTAFIVLIIMIPWIAKGYPVLFLFQLALNIAFAQSWNICSSYAGLLSLGHALFFGISGYVTVVICNAGMPIYISILIGAFASALFAAVISPLLMRLRAVYFAIGTMIICNAFYYWFLNWREAGGSQGLTIRIYPEYSLNNCYYLAWMVAFFATILLWLTVKSKLGLAALSIRDDVERSEALGVPTLLVRMSIFTIGAFLAGLVGGVRVAYLLIIEPKVAFSFDLSLSAVLAVVMGGAGTLIGPILGSIIITSLQHALMGIPEFSMLITGAILILIMLFLPGGLVSIVRKISLPFRKLVR
jgi:branched-chain amino acid transport system permease protein